MGDPPIADIIVEKFSLENAAISLTDTNTKLIKLCSDMFFSLQLIEWLADDPSKLKRIQGLARDSLQYLNDI